MITFTNEKNEKRNTLIDWGMIFDPEGVNTYILRFTSTPIEVRKQEINDFLKSRVKVSTLGDKWAKVTCEFGKPVNSGIQACFTIREEKEVKKAEPKVEPKVEHKPEPKPVKKEEPKKEPVKDIVKPVITKESFHE